MNAHTVNLAARDPGLRSAMNRATVLNDGIGADMASWLLYRARFPSNLNGTDLIPSCSSGWTAARRYSSSVQPNRTSAKPLT